jgi:hypothetical protein
MLNKVLMGIVAVLVIGVIVVASQPGDLHVERSVAMAASPQDVFDHVNDFHKWEGWSPWLKVDPNAKGSYEGPSNGVGAIFRWDGNDEVGAGSMTITESRPSQRIGIQLDFVRPMEGTNDVLFMFKPDGDKTIVTWSMSGKKNMICKAISLCCDMDKMIGDKYDEGLANLKAIVEAAPQR